MITYCDRHNGFQFRSPSYLDGHFEKNKFDLVKWVQREKPILVTDFRSGKEKMSEEYCFTVGMLTYDEKEGSFSFESCGLRFLEYYEEGLSQWILRFCDYLVDQGIVNSPED